MGAHLLPGEINFDWRKLWFWLPCLPWQSNCESMIVWNDAWKEDGWKKTECRIHLILNTIHGNSKNINRQFSIFLEVSFFWGDFWKFYIGCAFCAADDLNTGPACWLFRNGTIVLCIVIVTQSISKRERERKIFFRRKLKISTRNEGEDGCSNLDFLLVMCYIPTAVSYITKVPTKLWSPI